MKLIDYIADTGVRRQLASAVGANPEYLWQVATGWKGKRASRMLALAIERETNGAVSRHGLRPDIFGPVPPAANSEVEKAA